MAGVPQRHSTIFSQRFIKVFRALVAYVVLEDIIRDKGLVNRGVLVGLQVNKRFFRHALVCSLFCWFTFLLVKFWQS